MPRLRFSRLRALQAVAIFSLLATFFVLSHEIGDRARSDLDQARGDFTTQQMAERVERELVAHVSVVESLAAAAAALPALPVERFPLTALAVATAMKGFHGIALIAADGVILDVQPRAPNEPAVGRNALSLDEAAPYLRESIGARAPRLTGIIDLFQGGRGIIVYHPVFHGEEFLGWIAGVFRVDRYMRQAFEVAGANVRRLEVRRVGDAAAFYRFDGAAKGVSVERGRGTFSLLNQRFEVSAELVLPAMSEGWHQMDQLILFSALLLALTFSVLLYRSWGAAETFRKQLLKERYDSILINLLCHDLANIAMNLKVGVAAAERRGGPELEPTLARIAAAVRTQEETLARVRDMRAYEIGRKQLDLEPTTVAALFAALDRYVGHVLRQKSVTLAFADETGGAEVLVDRAVFLGSVLGILVTSAARFSEDGASIEARAWRDRAFVVIELLDHGSGVDERALKALFEPVAATGAPAAGEQGAGLGMLQVKAYMDFFGGRVEVSSRDKRAHPVEHGTTFRLFLPVAPR